MPKRFGRLLWVLLVLLLIAAALHQYILKVR